MKNILKQKNDMNLIGQGGKIILFMVHSLIAAFGAEIYLPKITTLPLPRWFSYIKPLGYVLLPPGILLWGTAVIQLMNSICPGQIG